MKLVIYWSNSDVSMLGPQLEAMFGALSECPSIVIDNSSAHPGIAVFCTAGSLDVVEVLARSLFLERMNIFDSPVLA